MRKQKLYSYTLFYSFITYSTFLYNIENLSTSFLAKNFFPKYDICFKSRILNKTIRVAFNDRSLKNVQ